MLRWVRIAPASIARLLVPPANYPPAGRSSPIERDVAVFKQEAKSSALPCHPDQSSRMTPCSLERRDHPYSTAHRFVALPPRSARRRAAPRALPRIAGGGGRRGVPRSELTAKLPQRRDAVLGRGM